MLVDGSQGAVHLDVDVQDLDCDFYVFTGHKLYGPTGIGVLYGKHEHLEAMPPFNGGGEMIREVFAGPHHLWRPAAQVRGGHAARSCRRSGSARRSTTSARSARRASARTRPTLVEYAHERLREINSLRIIGTRREKGAIVSFEMKGAHAHDIATIIDRSGVAVRAGTHCVMPLLARFGVTATCRASFALYNTKRGGRPPCGGPDQGAGFLRMTEIDNDQTAAATPQAPTADAGDAPRPRCRRTELARLTDDIIAALKTVYDPEIPADIYELGLIYRIDIADDRAVTVDMTLTTPNCPSAQELPIMVENAVASVARRRRLKVNMVWDPPWDPSRMSDEARVVLNMW